MKSNQFISYRLKDTDSFKMLDWKKKGILINSEKQKAITADDIENKKRWKEHLSRMSEDRLLKIAWNY